MTNHRDLQDALNAIPSKPVRGNPRDRANRKPFVFPGWDRIAGFTLILAGHFALFGGVLAMGERIAQLESQNQTLQHQVQQVK